MKNIIFLIGIFSVLGSTVSAQSNSKNPDPNTIIVADEDPRPLNMADFKRSIQYPEEARNAGIEGKVILKVLIDTFGKVSDNILLKSPHPLLTAEVIRQLPMLRFSPAIEKGKPIQFWVVVPVSFSFAASDTPISFEDKMNQLNWKYTASGLGYAWIDSVAGNPPARNKEASIYYTGFLTDGTQFDATQPGKPFTVLVGRSLLIKGWEEALTFIPVGSSVCLKIPPELGYGLAGTQGIPSNATLYFILQILSPKKK